MAEKFKGDKKDKAKNEVIFSFLAEDREAVTYRRFNIKSDNQVVFFYKSQKKSFRGEFTEEALLTYLQGQTDRSLHHLYSLEDFSAFSLRYAEQPRVLAVLDSSMEKSKKMLQKMLKKDVFADIGDFVLGYTDDQSIVPYPADTELPSLILYHP